MQVDFALGLQHWLATSRAHASVGGRSILSGRSGDRLECRASLPSVILES
jgi:hypothetical protein